MAGSNASTNTIEAHPDLEFDPITQLVGHIARMLDISTCDALSVFGVINEPKEKELLMNTMDLLNIVHPRKDTTSISHPCLVAYMD